MNEVYRQQHIRNGLARLNSIYNKINFINEIKQMHACIFGYSTNGSIDHFANTYRQIFARHLSSSTKTAVFGLQVLTNRSYDLCDA